VASQIIVDPGKSQQCAPGVLQPISPRATQHTPLILQVSLSTQQSASALHEEKLPLGAQHFPLATSQVTVPKPPSQQSEACSQPISARRTQHVPLLQVAAGSQQSEVSLQAFGSLFAAQHLPSTQVEPKSQQFESAKQPVIPVSMQQARWILQVAFGSQQSVASLQTLWTSASARAQHFPVSVSQVTPILLRQQSESLTQPGFPVSMQQRSLTHVASSLQQSVSVKQSALLTAQHLPPSQVTPEPLQHSNSLAQPVDPRYRQHVWSSHAALSSQQSE
jgi:hypothetical protein